MAYSTRKKVDPVFIRGKINEVKKYFDIAICCRECAINDPDRPKGEYMLLYTRKIEENVYYTSHEKCPRNWILAKERNGKNWYRIRHAETVPGPSGLYALCEYAADSADRYIEKFPCPAGDTCPFAHSDVECAVWSGMFQYNLDYSDLENLFKGRLPSQHSNGSASSGFITQSFGAMSVASSIPPDVVRPGQHFAEESTETSAQGAHFEIIVTKVDDPENFYIQKRGNTERINEMIRDMNAFYDSSAGDEYALIDDDLSRRLPVVMRCKSNGQWRRAEIIDFSIGRYGIIEVADVDFGGMYYLKATDIRLLRLDYYSLPKQAMKASLAYVCPMNRENWTKSAVEFTKAFLTKESLVAEIVGIRDSKLAVLVADTSDPDGKLHLTGLLKKKHYASSFNISRPKPIPNQVRRSC